VPFARGLEARAALAAQGYAIDWHQYPMGHSLCAPEVAHIRQFLLRVLPERPAS
jgi:phospholipase/carboxylesterase